MSLLISILLALAALPAWSQQPPVVVGAVVPQTGVLAPLAADYRKALLVWQDEVNAAGGLINRRVELRLHDDGSDATRAGELYAELIRQKTDLLIGPFGSAATLMAAAEAERAQRVLINGAGASLAVHKRGPRYVFQSAIPNSAYGTGVLDLVKSAGIARVAILSRDDPVSREMADAARERALEQGLQAEEVQSYSGSTEDFAPYVVKAADAAWVAFGEMRDSAYMLRTFRKLGYAPALFFARGAADRRLIGLVGQDAEFALAPQEYDARFRTPGNDRFAAAFRAKWGAAPGVAAGHGYAAATVLAEAVKRAGTLDQAKLRAMLARMEIETVLGPYKVDPESGEQVAARPAVVQIQRGRPEVVWPEALRTSALQPYPRWSERRLLE